MTSPIFYTVRKTMRDSRTFARGTPAPSPSNEVRSFETLSLYLGFDLCCIYRIQRFECRQ